jgi:hypothetical protein
LISLALVLLLWISGNTQSVTADDLLGEWIFVELRDENHIPHTEIPISQLGPDAIEHVNWDCYEFMEDGRYDAYNPYKRTRGRWLLDSKKNQIKLEMLVSKHDPLYKMLKKKGMLVIFKGLNDNCRSGQLLSGVYAVRLLLILG